jgi:SAM-dependent methyltransferase
MVRQLLIGFSEEILTMATAPGTSTDSAVTSAVITTASVALPAIASVNGRAQRERGHFNARSAVHEHPLFMSATNIRRYDRPAPDTIYPLEYAFHLLGKVQGRRLLNLGCGEGFDAVILAALGATVVAVDISDAAIALTRARAAANGVADRVTALVADASALPVATASIDAVLAAAVMHHIDIPSAAAELARALRPGCVAVFREPLAGPKFVQLLKRVLPLPETAENSEDERPLSFEDVDRISAAIGHLEARRAFGLTSRTVTRIGLHGRVKAAYRIDRYILKRVPKMAALASPLVWSARKPT